MVASIRTVVDKLPNFILARYPFVNALSLLMLLSERAKHESFPPLPPNVVYAHIGLFVVCGFCLSARFKSKEMSLLYAGQLLYFAYNCYTNPKLNYTEWQKLRVSTRQFGCCGVYLIYAYLNDEKRSVPLRRIGEIIIGLYLLSIAYMLNESTDDKAAFYSQIPGGDYSRFIVTLMFTAGALCFFSGYFLRDISMAMVIVTLVLTVLVDGNVSYWTYRKGMQFWNQMRIVLDQGCLITGFYLMSKKFTNRVKKDHIN
ncbi:hypothetical protein ScPMuIL_015025 [Solemya velum]